MAGSNKDMFGMSSLVDAGMSSLVADFVERLQNHITNQVREKAETAVRSVFTGDLDISPAQRSTPAAKRGRRKPPIQLCPVPGCQERGAPAFGMTCRNHKDLPKRELKRFRDERRAAKLAAKAA